MTQVIKKYAFFIKMLVIVGLLSQIDMSHAAIGFGQDKIDNTIQGSSASIEVVLQAVIAWIFGFLYVLAVLFGIYGGILILTAAGDEEKVKKGKTVIVNVVIGLIVIFLVSSVITWVINLFTDNAS